MTANNISLTRVGVSLYMDDVNQYDLDKKHYLRVTNQVGSQEYRINFVPARYNNDLGGASCNRLAQVSPSRLLTALWLFTM